jgi:hypothetical protein
MALDVWHNRLEQHFVSVSESRKSTGWPVFALEHGLSTDELRVLFEDVRRSVRHVRPPDGAWLPWIVYGAEQGYAYEGDEYWQSFEEATPGWVEHGDRYWLRQRFVRFWQEFGGARPSGAWADHFSIICWPITHAILPRDLQQQLARILYEVRYSFTAEVLRAPELLGTRIRAASYSASARFQHFASDPQLVGHIATALLLHDADEHRVTASTLERIVHDLEQEQSAREWLKSARQSARRPLELHGLGSLARLSKEGAAGRSTVRNGEEEAGGPTTAVARAPFTLEPHLLLLQKSDDEWRAWVDVPDLSPLTHVFPRLQTTLATTRCMVSGCVRPQPRGAFLFGRQRVLLDFWPAASAPLLSFDQHDAELEALMRLHCRVEPKATRLFKVDADGTASELRQLAVRPGWRYVMTTPSLPEPEFGRAVRLAIPNTRAYVFDVPALPSVGELAAFARAGLAVTKRIDVWPAGVPAGIWSGEGDCEWLSSEALLLGVASDHPLRTLHIALQGTVCDPISVDLDPPSPGEPTFIRLPALAPGIAVCTVHAENVLGETVDGALRLIVREPRPWSRGRPSNNLVTITVNPPAPFLEQLWEGKSDIEVRGPVGRMARATITLEGGMGALASKHLPPLALPIAARTWDDLFDRELRRDARLLAVYDEAKRFRLDVVVDDIGTATLAAEREFTPIRWRIRVTKDGVSARLLNDGGVENIGVARYSFANPLTKIPLDLPEVVAGFTAPSEGGLFLAQTTAAECGIIAPPAVRTFQDLACAPSIVSTGRSVSRVLELLTGARRWSAARLPAGIGAVSRQRTVLEAFADAIATQLCGEDWMRLERGTRRASPEHAGQRLAAGISSRPEHRVIGQTVMRELEWYLGAPSPDRARRFSRITKTTLTPVWPDSAIALEHPAEFVLRLVSDPAGFLAWAGPRAESGIRGIFGFQVYTRAARCLVLLVHREFSPAPIRAGHLYEGWTWDSHN